MNENINLVEILKDCPRGTKLYSTIHGEVKFEQIITNNSYPIVFTYSDMACESYLGSVTKDGRHERKYCGECTLFPSKENRNYDKFKVESEMVDGEFYYCNYKGRKYVFIYKKKDDLYKTNNYAIIKINDLPFLLKQNAPIYCGNIVNFDELRKATEEEKQQLLNVIKRDGYKWDEDKKELVKIEPELIDGEIYYAKIGSVEWIYIYKKTYTFKTSHYVAVLNNYLMEFNNICTTNNDNIKIIRKATEEERRLFFENIEKNGRKWDLVKKELVRIEKKFEISSLQHFDKILVRDCNEQKWKCDFYDSYANELDSPFRTTYSWYKQCIPYNDETKHLVSTTEMPPEKYINWEE